MTIQKPVRLSDVCRQDRTSVKAGQRAELAYIGLESIESNTGQFNEAGLSKTPEVPLANSFRFGAEHVLYGKLRPYLNKVALAEFEGKCSTEIIPLLPSPELDRRYLAYFLRSPRTVSRISEKTAGARMPRADMDFIFSLELVLPSLKEQRRIVDLLSRADSIVRLRRDAQKKAAELIPAIFLEMFGDPESNPKQLLMRRVADFVARFAGGKNIQAGSEDPDGYRILKVSAVTSGRYIEVESKPAPDNYTLPTAHLVREGDMLFSRANTVDLVGATAIVEATDGKTLLPDKLWRFVWAEEVDVRYMHALFQLPGIRRELGKLATGTSDSMRNISQAKLFALQLPIASLEQQRAFSRLSEFARSIQSQQSAPTDKAQATFDSLLATHFRFAKDDK